MCNHSRILYLYTNGIYLKIRGQYAKFQYKHDGQNRQILQASCRRPICRLDHWLTYSALRPRLDQGVNHANTSQGRHQNSLAMAKSHHFIPEHDSQPRTKSHSLRHRKKT